MKKILLALFLLSFSVWAEETGRPLYSISADAGAAAAVPGITRGMESRFDFYNRLFRFDTSLLSGPLRVRVFSGQEAYNQYLTERLRNRDIEPEAMYLHYDQIEQRELVINLESYAKTSMLAYQAFVQYFRAFIANPPAWMLEGFAIFFSGLRVDDSGVANYEENLNWLVPVKSLGDKLPSPNAIFLADPAGTFPAGIFPARKLPAGKTAPIDFGEFQISSWALVSFLLNSEGDYFRTLTDSFMLLSPSAGAEENSLAVTKRFSAWNDFDAMDREFRDYLASRKTFREFMEDGHRAYSQGSLMNAELSFTSAMDLRPSDYAPYYYLGLIFYERNNYDMAEQFYLAGLERGADAALLNYALGINAASAGRTQKATEYLYKAAALDPAKYRPRVEDVLKRIWR